jgi:hypothetical protein
VIFECNSMSCFESVPVEQHANSVKEFERPSSASLRNNWEQPFHEHVTSYKKRNLSHQSDVLNAMRGLFKSLSTEESPWHQYWGIPLTTATRAESQSNSTSWSHIRPHGVQVKTSLKQLHAAFCQDLCWIVSPEPYAPIRRNKFPSWSWSGWIAPVIWADTSPLTLDSILPLEVHVIRTDGTSEPLTEEVAITAFEDQGNQTPIYTYRLRICTQVFVLNFIYLEDEGLDPFRIYIRSMGTFKNAAYAARVLVRASRTLQSNEHHFAYWPLDLTPRGGIEEYLHDALCNELFQGVVLCKDYVLVTRTRNGVAERIGLVSVQGFWHSDVRLGDWVPSVQRDIILG